MIPNEDSACSVFKLTIFILSVPIMYNMDSIVGTLVSNNTEKIKYYVNIL